MARELRPILPLPSMRPGSGCELNQALLPPNQRLSPVAKAASKDCKRRASRVAECGHADGRGNSTAIGPRSNSPQDGLPVLTTGRDGTEVQYLHLSVSR